MQEALYNSRAELKRADHLINVSLKYTRTVDVIKHVVQRLISAIDFGMDALLLHAKSQGKIDEAPKLPRLKIDVMNKIFADDEKILDYVQFYQFLKKVDKAEFSKALEFRRHVTMTASLDTGQKVELNIDIVTDYDKRVNEFFSLAEKIIKGEVEE
jgi:hypothetical protein